jgi:hypothetical protein
MVTKTETRSEGSVLGLPSCFPKACRLAPTVRHRRLHSVFAFGETALLISYKFLLYEIAVVFSPLGLLLVRLGDRENCWLIVRHVHQLVG